MRGIFVARHASATNPPKWWLSTFMVADENYFKVTMKSEKTKQSQTVDANLQPLPVVADAVADEPISCATTFDAVLGRMKAATRTSSDTALAKILNLRQSSISGAKERQSIPPAWAVQIAQDYGVSLDWLMFGEGEMKRGQAAATPKVAAASPDVVPRVETTIYNDMNAGVAQSATNIADLVAKTIEVLQSKTVFQTALQSNIEAFHHAIVLEKKIDQVEDRIMAKISGRLDALEVSNQRLEEENAQLRQELESCRVQPGLEDTG